MIYVLAYFISVISLAVIVGTVKGVSMCVLSNKRIDFTLSLWFNSICYRVFLLLFY